MSGRGMTARGIFRRLRREELGATSIVVILMMTVLLVCAALVVDIGAIQARKAQLQDAADAAALAIAQECFESGGSSSLGCAGAVASIATATAAEFAVANVNDRQVSVESVEFTADTVRVTLASTQTGYFGQIADVDSTDLAADATARWEQQAVPLSLAMASCNFPAPGHPTVLQASLAVSNLLTTTLGSDCGLLSSENVLSGASNTVGVVSGGWLTSGDPILGLTSGSCEYDPNLLTTLAATVSKIAPTWCADEVRSWNPTPANPQRVILPVFDDGLNQLVEDDLLNLGEIDRYAVFDVTGYSFTGLLGMSTVPGSQSSLCTSPDGVIGGAVRDLLASLGPLDIVLMAVINLLLNVTTPVTGCQALQGTFVGFVDSEEAAQMLVGVQLID
jgi:Flp pilus assembly protein TadG